MASAIRPQAALFGLSAWVIPLVFILLPMAGFVAFSFWIRNDMEFTPALSLINYERWFAEPVYLRVFLLTLWLAFGVTVLDLLVGYPIAWYISRCSPGRKGLLLALIVAPLFMSFIVKLYAMRGLLGSNGYIAQSLEFLGLEVPVTALLYNQTSIFATMVLVYLPFIVLPIYATLSRLPQNLAAASADLGARPGQTFWRVVLPLSLPGTIVGAIFVFILAVGDYITPQFMGGTRGFTYGKLVWTQFGMAFEWPFGAAMGMMLLIVAIVAIGLAVVIGKKGQVAL
jgi:spermidine/putrescine transport system permease protein